MELIFSFTHLAPIVYNSRCLLKDILWAKDVEGRSRILVAYVTTGESSSAHG